MNYRHIFHAGNRCDVVKHCMLTLVLEHLARKDTAFCVLDTHAGVGSYDLGDSLAQKTREAEVGILQLLEGPALPSLVNYYRVLAAMNPAWSGTGSKDFKIYPGSPLIAFHMLRPQDRVIACELHPLDVNALKARVADKRMQVHHRDGYEALSAFLPPTEKRGVVLVDPPFEEHDEFETIVSKINEMYRRWPSGIYMLWYPIKDRPAIWRFHEALARTQIEKVLVAEFIYEESALSDRLTGSGMVLINPPWKLDEQLEHLFNTLHDRLKTNYRGVSIRWLTQDDD